MSGERPTRHPAGGETPDWCAECGEPMVDKRRYPVNDRLARSLFAAICRSMGLQPTTKSKSVTAPVYVRAPDAVTHERLWARYKTLMPLLDDKLLTVARDFILEHCSIDMPPEPPR